jgi:cysteinyl-tRNA synthetase
VLIAELFEVVRLINSIYDGKLNINADELDELKKLVRAFVFDVLGLKEERAENNDFEQLMEAVIRLRNEAKKNKDFATSDRIREELSKIGVQLKDSKDGTLWSKN